MSHRISLRSVLSRSGTKIGLGSLIAVSLLVTAILYASGGTIAAAPSASSVPQINAIYLADPVHPVLDAASVRAFGVRVVNDASALTTQSTTADAVIIDGSAFTGVSPGWLAAQLQQGRIIVGLNVPASQLEQTPGYRQPDHPDAFRQNWQGRSFYSLIYQQQSNGQLHVGAASDQISSSRAFLGLLNLTIRSLHTINQPTLPQTAPKATAASR